MMLKKKKSTWSKSSRGLSQLVYIFHSASVYPTSLSMGFWCHNLFSNVFTCAQVNGRIPFSYATSGPSIEYFNLTFPRLNKGSSQTEESHLCLLPTDGGSDRTRLLKPAKLCTVVVLNWPRSMLVLSVLAFEVFTNISDPIAHPLSTELQTVLKVMVRSRRWQSKDRDHLKNPKW